MSNQINDWSFTSLILGIMFTGFIANKRPESLNIDGWTIFLQAGFLDVEIAHTNFTEITRMAVRR